MNRLLAPLAARFPLETVEIPLADHTWRITAVQDQDALLDQTTDAEHIPYGLLLWESAVALGQVLTRQGEQLRGQRVLELGAGVGFPGLVAHSLGANVWQNDHRADVLLLADVNALQNGLTPAQHFVADWRTWTHAIRYDLLLGADILYERAMHPHLTRIFHQNLATQGRLLLADPSRPQALEFAAQMEKNGWQIDIEMLPVTLPQRQRPSKLVQVSVLTCWQG